MHQRPRAKPARYGRDMIRLFRIATLLLALVALGVPSLSLGLGIGVAAPVVVSADTVADAPE